MAMKSRKHKKTGESSRKKGLFSSLYDRLDSKMEESSKKSCSCCGKDAKSSKEEDDGCCS